VDKAKVSTIRGDHRFPQVMCNRWIINNLVEAGYVVHPEEFNFRVGEIIQEHDNKGFAFCSIDWWCFF
jgi:hypothetical protein